MKPKIKMIFCGFFTSVIFGMVFSGSASAAIKDKIMEKWLLTQYYTCANSYIEQNVDFNNENTANPGDFSTLLVDSTIAGHIFSDARGVMFMPSYKYGMVVGDIVQNSSVDCRAVLAGNVDGSMNGLVSYIGDEWNPSWYDVDSVAEIMPKYGYTIENNYTDHIIIKATLRYVMASGEPCSGDTEFLRAVCAHTEEKEIRIGVMKDPLLDRYMYSVEDENVFSEGLLKTTIVNENGRVYLGIGSPGDMLGLNAVYAIKIELSKTSLEETKSNLYLGLSTETIMGPVNDTGFRVAYYFGNSLDMVSIVRYGIYKYNNNVSTAATTIEEMSGKSLTGLELSNSEHYTLYDWYVSHARNTSGASNLVCEGIDENIESYANDNRFYAVRLKRGGEFRQCYVNFGLDGNGGRREPSDIDVTTQEMASAVSGPYVAVYPRIVFINMQEVIDWLNTVDINTLGDIEDETAELNVCYDGAGALGWILCPIVQGLTGVGEWMWSEIENNQMRVPAAEVFNSNGGVRKAWDAIRNVGNVIFVILFLVVIFSQLTGVGIDNYGIKKVLPRLILVAILVNLSWIICELAVDLSNIFGMGLNSMLTGFAESVAGATQVSGGGASATQWVTTIVLAGGGVALFLLLNPIGIVAAIFAILGVVISIVAAIIVLYLTLIIRQAGIILTIVLAPVAIVCYALPNTEKLSKKWFDLFKALLVVYPLCGLAIGAGKLAGVVLASISDDTGMKIAAMIVQVVPFFFIPALLRRSLSLMGNIGAKISQTGKRLSRQGSASLQKGIRDSEWFKDRQKYRQDQKIARRAQGIQNRYRGRSLDSLSDRQRDKLAKATKALNAEKERRYEAKTGVLAIDDETAERRAESRIEAQEYKNFQDQFANYNRDALLTESSNVLNWYNGSRSSQQKMKALIGAMETNGMENDIFDMLVKAGDVGGDAGVMQVLANSKDKVLRAYGKKGANMSYQNFMRNGTMRQYVGEKGSDFLNGLDDKALSQIKQYSSDSNKIMSTALAMQAATTLGSQDAIDQINEILKTRNDITLTGSQLAKINKTTYDVVVTKAPSAILNASDDIVKNNPQLINSMDSAVREATDVFRVRNGKPEM